MGVSPIDFCPAQCHIRQRLRSGIVGRNSGTVPARLSWTLARQGWRSGQSCAWTAREPKIASLCARASSCILGGGIVGGSSQDLSKVINVIFEVVFPEKGTHMPPEGAMEGLLPVAPKDAPRCNLEGYGLFKDARWRTEEFPVCYRRRDERVRGPMSPSSGWLVATVAVVLECWISD